jgi:Domain of unknown function (DUF4259)
MQGAIAYPGLNAEGQIRMGTWGSGYFSSDGAQDLVEDLAEMPADQRYEAVQRMLLTAATDPDAMWREVFPDTVIAAAALVAATLPGGADLVDWDQFETGEGAALPYPAPQLAAVALDAIGVVAKPGSHWETSWVHEVDKVEAIQGLDRLRAVLRQATV